MGALLGPTFAFGQTATPTPTPFDRPSFCRTPGLAIPDNNPSGVNDSLVIPDDIPITDLDVLVRMSDAFVGDMVVRLTHLETGTSATLIDRPLFPETPVGCAAFEFDVLLDDDLGPMYEAVIETFRYGRAVDVAKKRLERFTDAK